MSGSDERLGRPHTVWEAMREANGFTRFEPVTEQIALFDPALERAIEICMKPGPATRWLLAQSESLERIKREGA